GLVMVQPEAAERLAAAPGSRAYGVPSAKLAWFATARRAGPVPRAVFWPVPNVDSGLLAFERREPPPGDREAVFRLIDAAFAQRRKALRAGLAGWAGSPAAAEAALREAGIDPMAHAETLSVEDFARLAAGAAAPGPAGRPRRLGGVAGRRRGRPPRGGRRPEGPRRAPPGGGLPPPRCASPAPSPRLARIEPATRRGPGESRSGCRRV